MKICMIANAEAIHTQRWAKAYAQNGHEVYLLSIRTAELPEIKLITINVGNAKTKSNFFKLLSYLYLLFKVKHLVKQIKPDIVESCYVMTNGVIGAIAGFHPYVISVWGSDVVCHKKEGKM